MPVLRVCVVRRWTRGLCLSGRAHASRMQNACIQLCVRHDDWKFCNLNGRLLRAQHKRVILKFSHGASLEWEKVMRIPRIAMDLTLIHWRFTRAPKPRAISSCLPWFSLLALLWFSCQTSFVWSVTTHHRLLYNSLPDDLIASSSH